MASRLRILLLSVFAFTAIGCSSTGGRQADATATPRAPLIVAHRAGTADAPENTLLAITTALRNGADAIWLSVQLSADGVPVLYRPRELETLTDGHGSVETLPLAQLQALNAGYAFRARDGSHPYRTRPQPIPTLDAALAALPPAMPVMLDMKAAPSEALVDAVAAVLSRHAAWPRTWLYSTDAAFVPLWRRHPQARLFESRDATRQRLLTLALAQRCEQAPPAPGWAAFEAQRDLQVSERYTLGEGRSAVPGVQLWTPAAMACFRQRRADFAVMWIGVADAEGYRRARALGADAVMVDSPRQARQWRVAGSSVEQTPEPDALTAPAAR